MVTKAKTYESFHTHLHAETFDNGYNYNIRGLKKVYESFNEVKLFLEFKPSLNDKAFLEVGCATGELYRYLEHYHKDIVYFGLDISREAITRAKEKYPLANFFVVDGNKKTSEQVENLKINPSILFARDVIPHQANPFEFLSDLISVSQDLAIFRVRTRDRGKTVLDPEVSCQWYCGKWAPYMVLNIDEVVDVIKASVKFETLYITKHYMQLGGYNSRYLPKECYYPETKTAETSIVIKKSKEDVKEPKIIIREQPDGCRRLEVLDLKPTYVLNKLKRVFKNKSRSKI